MSATCPSSSSSKDSLRSASVLALTFIENQEHANAVTFKLGEDAKQQPQSGSTRLGAQVAFLDDYP